MAKLFERRSVTVVPDDLWRKAGAAPVLAGVTVNPATSMTFSAVYAAHKILGESVAMLPLFLLKRLARGKEPATDKRLYSILHDVANPEMDAYLVRETLTTHLAGWGRAHAKVDYDANGQITAIWPIPPNLVQMRRDAQKRLLFDVTLPDGQRVTYRSDEMLFLRGMSTDGTTCYSPIQLARQGIGLALAAEQFGAAFFGNGAVAGGVIQSPNELDDDAYDRMAKSWTQGHGGVTNAHKIAILEQGATYEKIGIPPDDAQFLETRSFQVQEIARWYRLPSMMLNMEGASATYASVEAFGLQFVLYTLYPWLVRWEKAISMQLLLERERKEYFAEHLMTALLRGDTQSRYASYAIGRQWGWLSVNDIREFENMNPVDGGDVYLTPLNMVESGKPANQPTRGLIQRAFLPVLTDAVGRVLKREQNDISSAGQKAMQKRGAEGFADWISEFYHEHQDFIVRSLSPAAKGYAEALADELSLTSEEVDSRIDQSLRLFALRHADQSQALFKQTEKPEEVFSSWNIERMARLAISQLTAALLMPKEPQWTS